MSLFETVFGTAPEATGRAPGRVNLMGDHTDYSGGLVLPSALPQETVVEVAVGAGDDEAYSATLQQRVRFSRGNPPAGFARYLAGCLRVLASEGVAVPPLRFAVRSDVPVGAGLSSSAALEVATLRAIDARFGLALDAVRIARLAQRAEVEHVGVACGIMDQMASSVGRPHAMLFIDTRSLAHRLLPLPRGGALVVVDSGVPRRLEHSAYNTRRAECEAAAAALGVPQLRDVDDPAAVERLAPPLRQRARHVISENARVLRALEADAAMFGRLMNESHRSLAEDFAVSVEAVDRLVGWLQGQDGVYGARMTGAGFGGACVALAAPDAVERVVQTVGTLEGAPRVVIPPRAIGA